MTDFADNLVLRREDGGKYYDFLISYISSAV